MSFTLSKEKFFELVSGLSLGVFRIMLGTLLVLDSFKNILGGCGQKYYDRAYLFHYEPFDFVQLYPEPWMLYLHFVAMLVFALGIAFGFFYRLSVITYLVLFIYVFLLDQTEYLNHYYLVIVYLFLMCFLPMNARLSFDVWQKRINPQDVPRWAVWVLMFQTEIVLLYAGVVKLNPDWLAGEPLGLWLREQVYYHFLGDLIFEKWVILAGAWGTVVLHLIGAPLLLFARTRLYVFFAYVLFHLLNSYTFNIGIFPYMTIGATLLFFSPSWPRDLLANSIAKFNLPLQIQKINLSRPEIRYQKALLCVLAVWLFFQIVIPLRPYLYPGNVAWTEEGHKFSWRMKLRDKKSEYIGFVVQDKKTGRTWAVNPHDMMDTRAVFQMGERVNLMLQYAHYLEEEWQKQGYDDVKVMAKTSVSLNGRRPIPVVDPALDLTEVEWGIWPANWIEENNVPLPSWKERE